MLYRYVCKIWLAFLSISLIICYQVAKGSEPQNDKSNLINSVRLMKSPNYIPKDLIAKNDLILARNPDDRDALLIKAVALSQDRRISESQKILESLIQKHPNWIYYYNFAYNYLLQGKPKSAIEALNKAEKLSPSFQIYALRSTAYQILGNQKMQYADLQTIVKQNKMAHSAYAQMANGLYYDGRYEEALKNINAALSIKDDPYYNFLKGMIQSALKDWNQSLASFDKSLAVDGNLQSVYIAKGLAYNGKKDYDKSVNSFSKAEMIGSKDAKVFKAIGYYHDNQIQQAKKILEKAINEKSGNPIAYIYYGRIAYIEGNKNLAEEYFKQAFNLNSRTDYLYASQGWFMLKRNEFSEALSLFDKSIQSKADNDYIFLGRGITNYQLKKYQAALSDLNKSILLNNQISLSYKFRGYSYRALGNTNKAEKEFLIACRLGDDESCNLN